MINEVALAENLLNGIGINKKCMYSHIYTLAKYYLSQGNNEAETRKLIFTWAGQQKIWIADEYNVNQIIYKARHDGRSIRDKDIIRVSKDDIEAIKARFDGKKVRKAALGLLCTAKAIADQDGIFPLSLVSFCNWVGIGSTQMCEKYMPELIMFEYVQKIQSEEQKTTSWKFQWAGNSNIKSKSNSYKILVPFKNEGEYLLKHNDLDALYDECFQ